MDAENECSLVFKYSILKIVLKPFDVYFYSILLLFYLFYIQMICLLEKMEY